MKQHFITPALALAVGVGLGVAVDRAVVGGSSDESSLESQSSARPVGPRVAQAGSQKEVGNRQAGFRRNANSDPAATIRRLFQKMESSKTVGIDYEMQFEAYETIRRMSIDDIQLAMHELTHNGPIKYEANALRGMLMQRWAEMDGEGAVAYALLTKNHHERQLVLVDSMTGWLKHDPDRAYQWYRDKREELQEGEMGPNLVYRLDNTIFRSLSKVDMATAFAGMKDLGANHKMAAMSTIASHAGGNAERREQFFMELNQLEDGELKRTGLKQVMSLWVRVDPEGATKHFEQLDLKPEALRTTVQSMAGYWGAVDPKGSLDWQMQFSSDVVPRYRIQSQFGQWVSKDSKAATEWLAKQPAEFAGDDLYRQVASLTASRNPKLAAEWALKIEDKSRREQALNSVYERVKRQGEEALTEWLDGLTPEIREGLALKNEPE